MSWSVCEHGDVRELCLRFYELGVIAGREERRSAPDVEPEALPPGVVSLTRYRESPKIAGRRVRRTRWGELNA